MRPRRRRASRFPRPDLRWRHRVPARRLAGQLWFQSNAVTEKEEGTPRWRGLAAALAAVELALGAFLAIGPLFQVRHVEVSGAHRLQAAQVRSLAGLDRPTSVFAVDAATIRRKLTATAWVREATVTTELPDRVLVSIDEWQPVAVYQAGAQGRPLYLSDQGLILGPAPNPPGVLAVQGPSGPEPKVGQAPLEATLLTALVNIKRQLPALIGQDVSGFQLDGCGQLTMLSGKGWKALFGRVITPEEIAALKDKLAALKSIAMDVNFNSPDLDYINLMNPSEPAVKLKSAKPAPAPAPTPAPSARPSARPSAAPSPVAPIVQPVITCA